MIEKRSVPPCSLFLLYGVRMIPLGLGNGGCAAGICRKHGCTKQALRPEGVISSVKRPYFKLTKSEMEIMDLLWKEKRPLCRSEIIALSPDRSWKAGSIHILLNSMLEKGAIQVAGFVQSTKNYARTFTPTLTADEYAVLQFKHSSAFNEQSVLCLVSALVEDIQDQDTLAKLGDILEKRKLQLG